MELYEAMRHAPSCWHSRNDGVPDDVLQPVLDNGRSTSSGGRGDTHEHDVERYGPDAPLTVIAEGTSESRRNVITQRLRARYAADG